MSPCEPSSCRSVSVNSIDGDTATQLRVEENGVRYPLFVPVASGLVSQSRPRATKSVTKPITKRIPNSGRSQKASILNTAESSAKKPIVKPVKAQNGIPGQRVPKAKPTGNSSESRKASPSRHQIVSSQHSPCNRPRAVSSPKRTLDTAAESSTLPRVKSPLKKTVNEIKPASESTCLPPKSSFLQEGEISRTSSQSSVCSSPGKLSHGEKRDNMSKIPSLARTPSADKQETKIPSRNPPKSKIPSISKADNKPQKIKEPETKKSQIPGLTRSDSNKGSPKSKIPSSSGSTPGKPDSAKENKDPVFADGTQETKQHKPTSRIPSFSSGSKASKMPSRNQTPVQNERVSHSSQEDRVDSSNKVKSTGIPMSRIPSFGKGTVDKPSVSGATVPSSLPLVQEHINQDSRSSDSKDTALSPESRIPHIAPSKSESSVQRSRIPGLTPRSAQTESKIPVTEKGDSSCDIHKPVVNGDASPITPDIPSSTETKSNPEKQHPSTPAITNGNENLVDNSLSEAKVTDVKQTNSELPPRREESPIEKYIRSEAQKVEQLLRDEKVVVEVRSETQTPNISDSSKAEISESMQEKSVMTRTTKDKETIQVTTDVKKVESELLSPEDKKIVQDPAGDLISDVLTSYAPDLKPSDKEFKQSRHQDLKPLEVKKSTENKIIVSELKTDVPESEGNKKTAPEQIALQLTSQVKTNNHADKTTVDDIYLQTFGSFGKKEDQDSPPNSRDKSRPMPPARTDSLGSKDAKDMGLTKKVEKPQVLEIKPSDDNSPETNVTPTETPAIDTLGQYEQQSRRSKSRTRKIISPDGDNDMDFAAVSREQPQVVRDIDKDKYGASPYTTEDEKAKVPKKTTKHDKPKFVIESSLGKDFYEAKRDSVQDVNTRPDSLVIANKTIESPPDVEAEQKSTAFDEVQVSSKDEFEEVNLGSQKESMKEIIQSMNDLDGKAKCIGCGGRGKCVIS